MSDATGEDQPGAKKVEGREREDSTTEVDGGREREDSATKAEGRREKELNEQAAEHQAEERRAEQEAKAIEQRKPEEPTDPDQLRGEIAEAREELGETVEALAAKADVKSQAKQQAEEQKAHAQAKFDEASKWAKENPAPAAAVGGGVLALLLLALRRRRR